MKFEEFERLIRKEYIEGLLSPFSPYITHRREYQGHHYPGYEIGLNTKSCKLLFVWEEGSGVMIGPLPSSFENTHDNWFSLDRIVCFLSHRPFAWEPPYRNLSHDEQLTYNLQAIQKSSSPYINQIMSLFSNVEKMSECISSYENYEDEQFKLKYPNFYEEYKKRKRH